METYVRVTGLQPLIKILKSPVPVRKEETSKQSSNGGLIKRKQDKLDDPSKVKKQKVQSSSESEESSSDSDSKEPQSDSEDSSSEEENSSGSDEGSSDEETAPEGDDGEPEADGGELKLLGNISSKGESEPVKIVNRKKKKTDNSLEKRAQIRKEEINHLRNLNKIHTYGADIPEPLSTFQELQAEYKVHPQIISNVEAVGFRTPTPIQMQAIPVMLHGREVMACAPTGSGKTAAFILPILHQLKEPRKQGFRALVLAPTRELVKQIYREFQRLADGRGFRIHTIDKSSTAVKKFGPKSSQKFDILVSTPNRLVFMLKHDPPLLNLSSVEWLVVDESDKLFEEGKTGFRDQLATVYKACDSSNVRRAMFSATFAHDVEEWCRLNLDNVVQVYIGARNSATDTVEQQLVFVGSESGKLLAIRDIIQKGIRPPVLVFVQSKDRAKDLFHELIYDGMNVEVIHANRTQVERDNILKSGHTRECFRSGKIWILICTELMGRGMDFKGVNLVINYDFPNSAISYIHRIGRTGRAGQAGKAITLFTEEDAVNLSSIANVMKASGCQVPDYMLQIRKPDKKQRKCLARKAQNP
ncbi:hypothetical protein ScPMuIL_004615 [Solemya velum]